MIYNVQALRAFAAISVVYFHTDFEPKLGQFGVDIFFVISGFIIAHITRTSGSYFLLRRLIRVVPLYWSFTILLVGIALCAPSLVFHVSTDWRDLLRSLLFIPYRNANGLIHPVHLIGWTLNYEMFFYVNIALALLIVPARFAAGVAVASMIGIQIALRTSNCTAAPCQFYSDPVMLEFLLGIAAFWIFSLVSWDRFKEVWGIWPLLFALSVVGLIIVATKPEVASVGNFPTILPPTAIFAFGVVLFAVLSESDGAVVKWRWVLLLGDASYLIYLVHPFIVQGFDRDISKWIPTLTTRTLIGLLVYLIALVSVSVMFHLKIERRILNLGRHFLERASTQLASAA